MEYSADGIFEEFLIAWENAWYITSSGKTRDQNYTFDEISIWKEKCIPHMHTLLIGKNLRY